MPKLTKSVPTYRRHKTSDQAVVTLNGQDYYLGPWRSKASKLEYDRLIGEWLARDRQPPGGPGGRLDLTIAEVLLRFWRFALEHYRKDGEPTREIENIRAAIRPLLNLYGHTLASQFGPLALKAIQNQMIDDDLSRRVINANIGRIKRVFKWAVSEELISSTVLHALQTVMGLQRNRTRARETPPVMPVPDDVVDKTIPHLPPVVADMVRFQRLVGCRPGEVRILRPEDIDRSEAVWRYCPSDHKMVHHDRERVVFIGPRAQEILLPYLLRPADAFCFQPMESELQRKAALRRKRKSHVQPSQIDRRKRRPRRKAGERYAREGYARAILRACDKAFPSPENLSAEERKQWRSRHRWTPNQLRHSCGTEVRRLFGLEGAQTVLGHSRADVTQIYAERDLKLAAQIMLDIG